MCFCATPEKERERRWQSKQLKRQDISRSEREREITSAKMKKTQLGRDDTACVCLHIDNLLTTQHADVCAFWERERERQGYLSHKWCDAVADIFAHGQSIHCEKLILVQFCQCVYMCILMSQTMLDSPTTTIEMMMKNLTVSWSSIVASHVSGDNVCLSVTYIEHCHRVPPYWSFCLLFSHLLTMSLSLSNQIVW